MVIPSSYSYRDLSAWGSHPLLDPLWGTESLDVVHDGCEATRPEKVAIVATSDIALAHLRICTQRNDETYNCGVCEKCVKTMVSLRIAGALGRCSTLPNAVDIRTVARIRVTSYAARVFARNNLMLARQAKDRPLALALAWTLRPRPFLVVRHFLGRLRREAASRHRARQRPSSTAG